MEWEPGAAEPAVRGLRNYVREIVDTLGQHGDSSYVQSEPLSLYLAVEGHLPGFAHRDVALLWDERHGWAGALETGCGEDLIVLSYVGGDPLPPPEVVVSYVTALRRGDAPGTTVPPDFPAAEVRRGLRWLARRTAFVPGTIPAQRSASVDRAG